VLAQLIVDGDHQTWRHNMQGLVRERDAYTNANGIPVVFALLDSGSWVGLIDITVCRLHLGNRRCLSKLGWYVVVGTLHVVSY
jgi:hypothetical protein